MAHANSSRPNFLKANAKALVVLILLALPLYLVIVTAGRSFNVTCDLDRPIDDNGELTPDIAKYYPTNLYIHGERCDSRVNTFKLTWLGQKLALADEPVLWRGVGANITGDDFTIRITNLPSFNTSHILRAERRGNVITVYGKQMIYDRTNERYGLGETKTHVLTAKEAQAFLAIYSDGVPGPWFSFSWNEALDGTTIFMETHDTDGYRVLSEQKNQYDQLDALTQFLFDTLQWEGEQARV